MRHGKKFNHLSRQKGHRRALMANMSAAIIEHKRIQTTLAKAKALRQYLEPLVTKAKNNTTHSRRVVFSYLQNKYAVQELFDNIAGKVADRPGGYLRIVRIGTRMGDAAEMALIEFVDYNETYIVEKKAKAGAKKKRTRRGKKKAEGASPVEAATEGTETIIETVAEAVVENTAEEVVAQVEEAVAEVEETTEEVVAEAEEAVAEVEETTEEVVAEAEEAVAEVEETTEEVVAEAEEAVAEVEETTEEVVAES